MNDKDKKAFEEFYLPKRDLMWEHLHGDQIAFDVWQAACEHMQAELAHHIFKIEAENAKLRKCVEFYSNTDNWLEEKDRNNLYTIIKEDASDDYCDYLRFGGKRARQVLKELEEK